MGLSEVEAVPVLNGVDITSSSTSGAREKIRRVIWKSSSFLEFEVFGCGGIRLADKRHGNHVFLIFCRQLSN